MTRYDGDSADAYELVQAHWPYDGPYDPELTRAAALMVARLVRYLNNATTKPAALSYVADAADLVASLHTAVCGLEQLVSQLGDFAHEQAGDPSLYDDRRDRPGSRTAAELVDALDDIGPAVAQLAERLGRAARIASHLGNST